MEFSALQIATLLKGRVEGDPEARINTISKIEEAKKEALSFIANSKYEEYLYTTQAGIIIVNDNLKVEKPVHSTLIRVKDAYSGFAQLLEAYDEIIKSKKKKKEGIQSPVYISDSATLGKDVYVAPFVYIGEHVKIGEGCYLEAGVFVGDDVEIGDHVTLFAGVKIYHDCKIGNHVNINAGTVIGADGFGFAPLLGGAYKKIPQTGNVVIEDHVEIGANATIDRATLGSTRIKKGVKLDNLIQIAHNVEVGENTVIAAQAGVSGSTKLGRHCVLGGQAGLAGHLTIADGTRINGQSGVAKSITEENTAITGTPAFQYSKALRSQVLTRNLPELESRIRVLENLVKQLTAEKEQV